MYKKNINIITNHFFKSTFNSLIVGASTIRDMKNATTNEIAAFPRKVVNLIEK